MKEIILTDEQAKVSAEADEPVELRDAAGTIVVKFDPMDAQALANHRRRKLAATQGTGIPGSRVRQQLGQLRCVRQPYTHSRDDTRRRRAVGRPTTRWRCTGLPRRRSG